MSNIIDTICSSVEFVLGQAFNSDRDYFMKLQETYETYYLGISFAFFAITLIMLPSFMTVYAGGITDANYLDPYLPYLFVGLNVLMYIDTNAIIDFTQGLDIRLLNQYDIEDINKMRVGTLHFAWLAKFFCPFWGLKRRIGGGMARRARGV